MSVYKAITIVQIYTMFLTFANIFRKNVHTRARRVGASSTFMR